MNNKKGFTLIELLAVIIILAIIALIAVPVISNIINSGKKSVARSNALHYIKALEDNNGYASANQSGYTKITGNKNVKDIKIDVKRTKPEKGTISINSDGMVTYAKMVFNGYWVEYNGTDAKVTGKYTPGKVNITFINDDTVIETRQINEGSTIGSFPNITLEENQELIGWYLDSEFNTVAETTTQVDDDISVYVKITRTCGQFATDSWEKISKNSYPVGCEKELVMDVNEDGTDETYRIQIINNTSSDECDTEEFSQSACGMVFQFKDVLNSSADNKEMNNNPVCYGGWPQSKMYTYLNTTIYNMIPSDLKSLIINTKVVSGHERNVTTNYVSTDKLYLLSTKEVGHEQGSDSVSTETRVLDYYLGTSSNSEQRKKYNVGTNYSVDWWLRSAYSYGAPENFYFVSGGACRDAKANTARGIAPAFRLRAN